MFALEMLTLGHSPLIGDGFCEMTVYDRHILPRDYLALRAYPFWEDAFILGHNHLIDFYMENLTFCLWLLFLIDYRDDDIFGISLLNSPTLIWLSTYLCWASKHPTFDSNIPASILSESYIFSFEPTCFIISLLSMTLSHSLDQGRMQTNLEFFGQVFICLWTLGSTFSMMVEPVSLLMYLWWCFHVDSWHVISWLACILDLESWLAFVWHVILASMTQELVWTFVDWAYMFSLHRHLEHPRISCMVTFCVLCWLLSYTGAYPLPWVHQIFFQIFSLVNLFLDLCESSYWGIPPSLSSSDLLQIFSLLDLFLDLCESSYWGIPPLAFFYWGIPPSLGLSHLMLISWLLDHLLIFTSYHLGHPPTVSLLKASQFLLVCLKHPPIVSFFRVFPFLQFF